MAHLKDRRSQNVPGDLYVDNSCIDCDTCRWMAPHIFNRQGGLSAVHHQPQTPAERQAGLQALLSCPTASIGTVEPPKDIRQVQATLPTAVTQGVYHCGYHSDKSFGAASYLIQRNNGNILVDSPRFTPPLVQQLEALGGVKFLYLTHRDDVADHQQFHDHFGCERILHSEDVSNATQTVEHQLTGNTVVSFAEDVLIIPVPGHTRGHTVLLYDHILFSGDHLAWSEPLQHLFAFRRACWYSWEEQIKSMEQLAQYSFEWVLPGHGHRYHASQTTMAQKMQQCLRWMKQA
ncbi:MAG: MBL fold metallo-hydrolase [Cyanobacteria bacterium J06632_22]